MRAVVQRVTSASVAVDGETIGAIQNGLCVLLGVSVDDTQSDADYISDKLLGLRIFDDENGVPNKSVVDIGGTILLISQFTLLGDARGQNRPGFTRAEAPERANALYEACCEEIRRQGVAVANGVFRTHMMVHLINDGPVTILLDSRKTF